jgi:xylulokinase
VATLNAARVLVATAQLLGVDLEALDDLARQAPAGADGLVLLPYLDGERTPNLPDARGSLTGLTRANMTPAHLARAAMEGMLCGLADAVEAAVHVGVTDNRILLIGGAARSRAVCEIAASLLGSPVVVPEPAEYVAIGAARQAAWVLSGSAAPPEWAVPAAAAIEPDDVGSGRAVRAAYAEARERVLA